MESIPDPDRLRRRLRESLKAALKGRDSVAALAIRSAMSAIDNAEAVDLSHAPPPKRGTAGDVRLGVGAAEAARRELSAREVVEAVRAEITDRAAAVGEYERLGRTDEASRLKAQANALASILEAALEEP